MKLNKNLILGTGTINDLKTKIYNNGNKIKIGNNVILRSKSTFYQAGMPFSTTLLVDEKGGFFKKGIIVELMVLILMHKKE